MYNIVAEGSWKFLFAHREPLPMVTSDSLSKNWQDIGSGSLREGAMAKISGVYEIVNKINGKRYIGSSVNIAARLQDHKNGLRNGWHHNSHLQSSFNKHGELSFVFRPIVICDPELLLVYEQMCIDALSPEYNKTNCAARPMLGVKLSKEHRAKLSKAKIGNTCRRGTKTSDEGRDNISRATKKAMQSPEIIRKISEASKGHRRLVGYKHSQESRENMSRAHIGKYPSNETKAKMSVAKKGKKMSDRAKANMSKAQKGHAVTAKARANMSIAAKGNTNKLGSKLSAESRARISESIKGRKASPETRAKMSAARKGENGSNHKLTWKDVEEIRRRYIPRKVSTRKLAKEFGVDQQVIWAIVNNKTWKVE